VAAGGRARYRRPESHVGALLVLLPIGRLLVFGGGVLAILVAALVVLGSGVLGDTASELSGAGGGRPGIGIRSLGLINLLLAYVLVLMILDLFPAWQKVAPRLQGLVTLIATLIGVFAAIAFIFVAFQLLMLMLGLLFSPPFGTMAYFALFGRFDTETSRRVLAAVMSLQILGTIAIVVVNPTLLKNLLLLLLVGSALLLTFVLGLLHALPPSFLVSIADAIGAIVAGILGAVWMFVFLIFAIVAVLRALRSLVPS
jgi:hypothetical protein